MQICRRSLIKVHKSPVTDQAIMLKGTLSGYTTSDADALAKTLSAAPRSATGAAVAAVVTLLLHIIHHANKRILLHSTARRVGTRRRSISPSVSSFSLTTQSLHFLLRIFQQIAGRKQWWFMPSSMTPYVFPAINANGFSCHTKTKIGKGKFLDSMTQPHMRALSTILMMREQRRRRGR